MHTNLCFLFLILFCLIAGGCRYNPEESLELVQNAEPAIPALEAGATTDQIADFLIALEELNVASSAFTSLFPELDRGQAYAIQLSALNRRMEAGDRLIGWKMGGTRVTADIPDPDPSFAYILESDKYDTGTALPASRFLGGSPMVEAEIAIHFGADLIGPEVSLQELLNAISGVSASTEFISARITQESGEAPSTNHMIAGRLSHAGVQLSDNVLPLQSLDMVNEEGFVMLDGQEVARGAAYQIMGSSPIDAVHWLANELPKHGLHLRAGDFVITGSLIDNPTLEPGQEAEVAFNTLGSIATGVSAE